jgi:hypothetical protein
MTTGPKFISVSNFHGLGAPVAVKIVLALMDFRLYINIFFFFQNTSSSSILLLCSLFKPPTLCVTSLHLETSSMARPIRRFTNNGTGPEVPGPGSSVLCCTSIRCVIFIFNYSGMCDLRLYAGGVLFPSSEHATP